MYANPLQNKTTLTQFLNWELTKNFYSNYGPYAVVKLGFIDMNFIYDQKFYKRLTSVLFKRIQNTTIFEIRYFLILIKKSLF